MSSILLRLSWSLLFLSRYGSATTSSNQCIPLELLTSPAHGLDLSFHGLITAVEYHNGTIRSGPQVQPSSAYIDLLKRNEAESNGSGIHMPETLWRRHTRPPSDVAETLENGTRPSFRQWILSFISPASPPPAPSPILPPLTTGAKILHEMFCQVKELAEADGEPMKYVGLSLPPWWTDVQALDIYSAATRANLTVKKLVSTAIAAAAAAKIDLCRPLTDYSPCQPERVMSLDLSIDGLTAKVVRIPGNPSHLEQRMYSVNRSFNRTQLNAGNRPRSVQSELTSWINDFVRNQSITNVFLIGSDATNPTLIRAVKDSDVAGYVRHVDGVPPDRVVAFGVAHMIKDSMESQVSDCLEPVECDKIREEADRLAGVPFWSASVAPRTEL
ncbi:MAG: hypothetical protein M1817_003960 [Caeruleum heppii]|nr:MAG: hypothetical protein M1817_003960 [Caeruleum heppii]